ncbi:MAG TPA: crosslink repair DNA glycosylase YcaQ family protein, partial [Nocardioides sp.]|nr:crosslink repair DNA glycosylase YcaQ family protein [Nocardioides sp.]
MMTDVDVARWRLRSQHLTGPAAAEGAEAAVRSLLAVQAENPGQSAWAVAARTTSPAADDLASLLDGGRVVRTHVLRPTWHYVAADDLVWLLELTAPRVRRSTSAALRTAHGIDERRAEQLCGLVLEALTGRHLSRREVAELLDQAGHPLTGQALMILLAELELRGLVVSGPVVDGLHTYALLAERISAPRRLDREEALAELAL